MPMRLKLAATDRRPDFLKNSYRVSLDLFEFIHAGILTTVQDLGRFGYQRYGVPVSGAMDCFSFKVANILAGNDKNLASLEMTLAGPTLRVINPCTIAITGADMNPTLNGEKVDVWASRSLKTGDVLAFSSAEHGCRAYLAVSGGVQAPEVLGSRSTYLRGVFGGYRGRPIRKGDVLQGTLSDAKTRIRYVPPEYIPSYPTNLTIRVVLGPQEDFFTDSGVKTFLNSTYEISPASDRMGYRLDGPRIEHSKETEIVSDGVAVGAIQVPGDRMPIILMRDAQTTGGYPKIAHVVSSDVNRLAQLRPGDNIRFEQIDIRRAHELIYQNVNHLNSLKKEIGERHLVPEFPDGETLMRFQGAIR